MLELQLQLWCVAYHILCMLAGVICGQEAMKTKVKRKPNVSNRDRWKTPLDEPRVKLNRTGRIFSLKSTCRGKLYYTCTCEVHVLNFSVRTIQDMCVYQCISDPTDLQYNTCN